MKKLIVVILAISSFACSPKKEGVRAGTVSANGTNAVIATNLACSQGMTTAGFIFDGAQINYQAGDVTGTFQDRLTAFLSTTMTPIDVGMVNPQMNISNGVLFSGLIKLDGSGNVVGAQSRLSIEIRDSVYTSQLIYDPKAQPIIVQFDPSKGATITGQFNAQTMDGSIVLHDSYGDVRFDGKLDAQNFSGFVRFTNSVSVVGQIGKGTIGSFTIPRCALLQ